MPDVRLIDANALRKDIHTSYSDDLGILEHIDNAPTIDAQPVKHGKWIFADDGYCRCSECKQKAPCIEDEATMTDYCPHCGKKMNG